MTPEELDLRALLGLPDPISADLCRCLETNREARTEMQSILAKWLSVQSTSRAGLARFAGALGPQLEILQAMRLAAQQPLEPSMTEPRHYPDDETDDDGSLAELAEAISDSLTYAVEALRKIRDLTDRVKSLEAEQERAREIANSKIIRP